MLVTAKLSREFYERFGDDIVNELVDLLNRVDEISRADLRELNELNFARFDAKQEQRFAEFWAKMEGRFAEFGAKVDQRFIDFAAKFDQRFVQFDSRTDQRFASIDARLGALEVRVAESDTRMERALEEHTRWFMGTLLSTVLALGGLIIWRT